MQHKSSPTHRDKLWLRCLGRERKSYSLLNLLPRQRRPDLFPQEKDVSPLFWLPLPPLPDLTVKESSSLSLAPYYRTRCGPTQRSHSVAPRCRASPCDAGVSATKCVGVRACFRFASTRPRVLPSPSTLRVLRYGNLCYLCYEGLVF